MFISGADDFRGAELGPPQNPPGSVPRSVAGLKESDPSAMLEVARLPPCFLEEAPPEVAGLLSDLLPRGRRENVPRVSGRCCGTRRRS